MYQSKGKRNTTIIHPVISSHDPTTFKSARHLLDEHAGENGFIVDVDDRENILT